MDTPCFLLLLIGITIHKVFIFAQETDELDKHPKFHEHERHCTFRRHQGFCRRRSECNKPTRHICRFGHNPVVCCLDEQRPKTTTISTTHRPTTAVKLVKRDAVKKIDLTFPGCGLRLIRTKCRISNSNSRRNSRRLISSRQGKSVSESFQVVRGKRNTTRYPLVVGGVPAVANSWPWMTAVIEGECSRCPKDFLCGASLISKKYVLSAAHCFDSDNGSIDPSKYSVVVGSHTTKDGTEYPVQKILIHHDYKRGQLYNDISLLQIQNEVELSAKVYPVCLPSDGLRQKIDPSNNYVTVTGWGLTSFGGTSSKVLQELTIPIVPLKECNTTYSKLPLVDYIPEGITNAFICAGVKEGGKDACYSDSGGPLVSKLKGNSYVQLGVVSFGHKCAEPGIPGVYTRISRYTKWLYDNTDLGKA